MPSGGWDIDRRAGLGLVYSDGLRLGRRSRSGGRDGSRWGRRRSRWGRQVLDIPGRKPIRQALSPDFVLGLQAPVLQERAQGVRLHGPLLKNGQNYDTKRAFWTHLAQSRARDPPRGASAGYLEQSNADFVEKYIGI